MANSEGGHEWWRNAVIYQVYVRSFADGNGDGTGDIAGLRERLPYIRDHYRFIEGSRVRFRENIPGPGSNRNRQGTLVRIGEGAIGIDIIYCLGTRFHPSGKCIAEGIEPVRHLPIRAW